VAVAVVALVPAAGRGARAGGALPKQLREVRGRALVAWSVSRLRAAGVEAFVVAAPSELVDAAVSALRDEPGVRVVAGGGTRQESVALALAASEAVGDDLLVVHDAARPAVRPEDVAAAIAAAAGAGAAVLGRPATDTVKRVRGDEIVCTVDRSTLFRAETPQVFRREVLERALAQAVVDDFVGTDESSLVERLPGVRVVAVHARFPNPKVTFAEDLAWVASLLAPALDGAMP
jgi:2-C-methyl-D-erythritol 4-phosphate cytidylyltransferase